MERRAEVELFEEIGREYEFGIGTIQGVASKLGIHRRMVRQALARAEPPARKRSRRERPTIGPVRPFIDAILEADRNAPRKQRHMVIGVTNGSRTSGRSTRWRRSRCGSTCASANRSCVGRCAAPMCRRVMRRARKATSIGMRRGPS